MNETCATRILVVDDKSFIRTTIKQMLRTIAAFDVLEILDASNGPTALELVRSSTPNLVLCDVGMLPMSGLDFVRELRGLPDRLLRQTPVIMLTANAQEETVAKAMSLGANGYLLKPVSTKNLRARIEATFKRVIPSPNAIG